MENLNEKLRWLIAALVLALATYPFASKGGELVTVTKVGKGAPMILIHGMSCSSAVWDEWVDRYKGNYELHLVTIAGFGNKQEVQKDHLLRSVRDEIIDYITLNKLQKPIMVGHSMGGFLSMWIAATAPDLTGKVVSVDGLPYFPAIMMPNITPEMAKSMAANMGQMMASMDEAARKAQQKMIVASMVANTSMHGKVEKMGDESNSKMTGQAYSEMYTTDIREEMKQVKVPVLVLGAWYAYRQYGSTKESTTASYKAQIENIKNAKLEVADTAYHFIFYDEPEWFYAKVNEFLAAN